MNGICAYIPNAQCSGGLHVVDTDGSLTELELLRRYRSGLGQSVVQSAMVNVTVPFSKSILSVPTEQTVMIRLRDRVTILVLLVQLKWAKMVSVLLGCFCCVRPDWLLPLSLHIHLICTFIVKGQDELSVIRWLGGRLIANRR